MKVLISTDTVGDAFAYTAALAAALQEGGDEVVVATMGPPLRRAQREALPARVYESGFRPEWTEDPWAEVAAAGEYLLALEERERPDLVHLYSYAHASAPFQAPRVLVAHSCALSWWRAVHGAEAPQGWNRYRAEMAAGLESADVIVAPTAAMLHELERDNALNPANAQVIHNGSPTPRPTKLGGPSSEREPFVLGSGRFWDAAKNLAVLDAAAEGLAWPVVVAGDLGDGDSPQHALSTGVLDSGRLAALRQHAPIYAAPVLYEPFGPGILEAARDGCALVIGDIPSLRELWEDAAIFVDPRDPNGLREVLACLTATVPA
jgi:glycogen(starch) synthase